MMADGHKDVVEKFSPAGAAKRVLRSAATAALATLSPDGSPFCSLVSVATTPVGEPILLVSNIAVHAQNLVHDERAALLLTEPGGEGGDPLAGARLTLVGQVGLLETGPLVRRRFLAHHPEAERYAGIGDFGFHRFFVASGRLVAGFGRIVELTPGEILTTCSDAADLIEAEAGVVEHMNRDRPELVSLYATRLLRLSEGRWHLTGADPDGLDLSNGVRPARLPFPARITTAAALRSALEDLGRAAHAVPVS